MPARVSTYKSVSLTLDDYDVIDKLRQDWIKRHKVDISIAKMIRLAVEKYAKRYDENGNS